MRVVSLVLIDDNKINQSGKNKKTGGLMNLKYISAGLIILVRLKI